MADSTWAVVFGGPSPEHEISILTGLQAARVLSDEGCSVHALYVSPTGGWYLVPVPAKPKISSRAHHRVPKK